MKKITLMLFALIATSLTWAQCGPGPDGQYPSATITVDAAGSATTINTCNYSSEFSVVDGIVEGNDYEVSITLVGVDLYVTVENSADNSVIAFGESPFTFTAPAGVTGVNFNWSEDAACTYVDSGCRVTTITDLTAAANACAAPSDLVVSNITDMAADLTWTANGLSTVDFNVEVYLAGETAAASNTPVFANANVVGTTVAVTGLSAATDYDAYIVAACSGATTNSTLVGPTSFTTTAACSDITAIMVANITSAGADISWTIGTGNDAAMVEVYASGESAANGDTAVYSNAMASAGSDTATGLMDNTAYDVFVTGMCGVTATTAVGPESFTTECGPITPDYTADMSMNVPDACWDEAGSGDLSTGPMDLGGSDWRQGTSYALGSSNAINLYFNNDSEWLLSPSFDLSTGGPYQLEVNVAVTDWNSATADATMGSDDEVQLLMTTDAGATWTNVTTWNAANEPPVGGVDYVEDLTAITGNVQFAIYATDGAVDDTEDYDFHVGKFVVRVPPACSEPLSVMSVISDMTADFTWATGASETTWQYANLASPSTEPTTGTSTTDMMASITGLTPLTDYDFYVRSDCGGIYSEWVVVSYTTPGTPPVNDECADAISLTVNADLECTETTSGTIAYATASGEDESSCFGTENDDVWFSFVATTESHKIELLNVANGTTDLYHSVWSGSCGTLTNLNCSDPNSSTVTGLTIGETYLLRVYSWTSASGQTSTFDVCIGTPPAPPAPPANDECDNAVALTVNLDYDNSVVTAGTTVGATASAQTDDVTGTPNTDVWFSFVALYDAHRVEILDVVNQGDGTSTSTDMGMGVYDATGGCTGLVLTDDSDPNTLNLTGLVPGTTYYVRAYGWFSTVQYNNFNISVGTDSTLGVNTFDNETAFTYFPNPVKNTLTLNAQNTIENVAMYNMLGQEVLRATPNTVDSELDMSQLQTGAYFVKVTIANITQTIRVIKQ